MTDSDDTDILLLIPPDIFQRDTPDSESSKYSDEGMPNTNSRYFHTMNELSKADKSGNSPGKITWKSFHTPLFNEEDNEPQNVPEEVTDKTSKVRSCNRIFNNLSEGKMTYENRETGYASQTSDLTIPQIDKLIIEMEAVHAEISNKIHERCNATLDVVTSTTESNKVVNIEAAENENTSTTRRDNAMDRNSNMDTTDHHFNSTVNRNEREENDAPSEDVFIESHNTFRENLGSPILGNLMSLSKLFSEETNLEIVKQKLKAECFKKQYCEKLINKLQARVLQQQQDIAIALKIDQEKDEAILKLQEESNEFIRNCKMVNEERNKNIARLRKENQNLINSNEKTLKKLEETEKQCISNNTLANEYRNKNISLKNDIKHLKEEYELKIDELEKVNSKMNELQKLCDNYSKSFESEKCNVEKLTNNLITYEENLKLASERTNKVQELLHKEQIKNKSQQEEMDKLKQLLEENNNILSSCKIEIEILEEEKTKMKTNIKNYYQNQLDDVVRNKLKEFKDQLENVETDMKIKSQRKEEHLKQSHKFELEDREKKHREDVRRLQCKIMEQDEKIKLLKKQLEEDSLHKVELAKRLQNMMESQWIKMLHLIVPEKQMDYIIENKKRNNVETDLDVRLSESDSIIYQQSQLIDKQMNYPSNMDQLKDYIQMLLESKPVNSEDKNKDDNYHKKGYGYDARKPPWK